MDLIINYGLIILGLVISVAASIYVEAQYAKKKKIANLQGKTGAEMARYILDKNGLSNVEVLPTGGMLSDHYNPSNKTVNLSEDIYHGTSIASIAVAAHEVGHAIQDKEDDKFMRIRHALVPIVNFSSYAGYIAIFIGLIASSLEIFWIGIFLLLAMLVFQIVTLPVEFGASNRALKELDESYMVEANEIKDCKSMLTAAALTYVASVVTTLLEILRLILMVVGTNRNEE